jgi:hypothetical protein
MGEMIVIFLFMIVWPIFMEYGENKYDEDEEAWNDCRW